VSPREPEEAEEARGAFSRLLDLFDRLVIGISGAALVFLVAMMGWMVFGRYVLNDTPTWVERAATLTVLGIALPVAAIGVRERFHLSVLGFREALPERWRRGVEIGCDIAVGLFGAGMAFWGWELYRTVAPFKIPLLGISQGWTYAPMVVSGVLIALFAIEQVLLTLRRRRTAAHDAAPLE